jgi:hypothetical protein
MCFWKCVAFEHATRRDASKFACEVNTYLGHRLLDGRPQHWSPRYSDHNLLYFVCREHMDGLLHPWVVGTQDTLVYRIVDDSTPRERQSY